MKKFICVILTLIVFCSMSFPAFAGSVPWDLAEYDEAVIFFGQVKKGFYGAKQAVVKPVKVIKGDVPIDGSLVLVDIGLTPVIPGNTYIFASYSSENHIFFPDSYDTETLQLSERSAFYDEVQKRINSGRYKDTDNLRIDRNNELLITEPGIKLRNACGISKDNPEVIKSDYLEGDSLEEFLTLCEQTEVFPVDISVNIDNRLIAMTVETENNGRIDITSDGKIQVCKKNSRDIYVISTSDRDKLLSLLPEENLPHIHQGTILTVSCITAALLIIIGLTVRKTKRKTRK